MHNFEGYAFIRPESVKIFSKWERCPRIVSVYHERRTSVMLESRKGTNI